MRADKDGLIEVGSRNGRYIFNYVDGGKTLGVSTGIVVFLVILFLIVGLAVGLVGGVYVFIKRAVEIPLPGPLNFFNPNYDKP